MDAQKKLGKAASRKMRKEDLDSNLWQKNYADRVVEYASCTGTQALMLTGHARRYDIVAEMDRGE